MTIKVEMKCDYSGYCHQGPITPKTEKQEGWFEIEAKDDTISVRRLKATDDVNISSAHACPLHGDDVAAGMAHDLKIFEVPETEVPSES